MDLHIASQIARTHLTAKKRQTLVAMLGVTFGIAMFITMISFMQGVNQFLEDSALDASPHIRLYNEVNTQRPSLIEQLNPGRFNVVYHQKPKDEQSRIKNGLTIAERIGREPGATIHGPLGSVQSICAYFSIRSPDAAPDLVIADIQLSDGVSFDAFRQVSLDVPVIFTTAYDEYAIRAFKLNSIDYLLKPVDPSELKVALEKFHRWQASSVPDFSDQLRQVMAQLAEPASLLPHYKRRFSGHYLRQIVSISQEEVAYFLRNELIYLFTNEGKKLITDYKTLDELDELVDPARFFRANRQCIVALDAIVGYRPHDGQKLQVLLKAPNDTLELIVSKEKAGAFRNWMEG